MRTRRGVPDLRFRSRGGAAASVAVVMALALLVSAAVTAPAAPVPAAPVPAVPLPAMPLPAAAPSPAAALLPGENPALRVGTYDSRAIAVAYARSAHLQTRHADLMRRRAAAEAAGDDALKSEIEAQGGSLQLRLRLQGFSTAPVDDILDAVRDRLPDVARAAGVAAIMRSVDFHGAEVEIVDVTDALVALFDPDADVLSIVAELRSQPPVALEVLARSPAR
jgi:hypothetical protein